MRQLKVGDIITLPNARIDRIKLEFRRPAAPSLVLAEGELGVSQGRKAFRFRGGKAASHLAAKQDNETGESIFLDDQQS